MYLLETWIGWTIMSAIGSIIAAIVAIFYTYYTYQLLQKTNQTFDRTNTLNEFEIYRQMSDLFNTDISRRVVSKCLTNKLKINYSGKKTTEENCIDSSDLNQLVLNPLEDLAMFWKKKLITVRTINEGIGYKILKLGNCQAILDHILKVREEMPNVFSGFEELYAAVYKDSTAEEQVGHRPTLFINGETHPPNKKKMSVEKIRT